jgi:hypothetical protein
LEVFILRAVARQHSANFEHLPCAVNDIPQQGSEAMAVYNDKED